MREVLEDWAQKICWTRFERAPPLIPVNPTVIAPSSPAFLSPFIILGLFPDVDIPTTTSPG